MQTVRQAFEFEMAAARTAYGQQAFARAFAHLERAHILGQRSLTRHWRAHWWMLKVGVRLQDRREVAGQLVRLLAVIPGFIFGWIPLGNTGGANVSAVRPMPLPDDLKATLGPVNIGADVTLRLALLAVVLLLLSIS